MTPDVIPKETLPHLIRRVLSVPRSDALIERVQGVWRAMSSEQILERVENLACAIRGAGLRGGDRVALIANDCIDWIVCDFATFFAGCVVVPIYPTQALDHTEFIIGHSGAKLLFVDTPATLERLRAIDNAPRTIVFFGGDDDLATFEAGGAALRAQHPENPAAYCDGISADDLAVLIYTSGTTGQPKGVMLSHDNLGFDAQSALNSALEKLDPGADVLSVLPFSHIYEHTMIYIYMLAGMRYSICHDPQKLLDDLRDVRPQAMTAVPRIFERVLAAVNAQALKHGGAQARLVPWALRIGREYMNATVLGSGANRWLTGQYGMAKRLVFDKLRGILGLDHLKYFTSGSAALHTDVAMTFLGIGLPIIQGYGLTETSPIITVNRISANRYGTVGRPIDGVEVKLAEDGEILTRGRHVMLGYYHDPDATAAAITDGWLHTGDVGELGADGYLTVTDRKKEVFKTATGKFVSPARVESAIKRSLFVSQVLVIGDGRPHPAALVCPNWDMVRVELKIDPIVDPQALVQRDDVRAFMTGEIGKQTADLAVYEQIRRVILIPDEFSVETGELSPSMKVKRRVVEERYRKHIDDAYTVDLHARSYV